MKTPTTITDVRLETMGVRRIELYHRPYLQCLRCQRAWSTERGQPRCGSAVFSLYGGIVQTDATSPLVVYALGQRAAASPFAENEMLVAAAVLFGQWLRWHATNEVRRLPADSNKPDVESLA
jgi:hypothetical protein